jgi:hypothetical protein
MFRLFSSKWRQQLLQNRTVHPISHSTRSVHAAGLGSRCDGPRGARTTSLRPADNFAATRTDAGGERRSSSSSLSIPPMPIAAPEDCVLRSGFFFSRRNHDPLPADVGSSLRATRLRGQIRASNQTRATTASRRCEASC